MAPQLGATFVPGSDDDYFMPEVVAPSPQRYAFSILFRTPVSQASLVLLSSYLPSRLVDEAGPCQRLNGALQPFKVPQNMQEDLQRMELEAREIEPRSHDAGSYNRAREPSLSTYTGQNSPGKPLTNAAQPDNRAYGQNSGGRTRQPDTMDDDAPSFSPFPKVVGDNVPPADEEKEKILWKARNHVLHSQNVNMQITWARDVLNWAEISMDAAAREAAETGNRPPTPRKEHELRNDAVNIIRYLAEQEHPDALYIRAKWLEFGKFGDRVDKREAYAGYKKASDLGNTRSVYRMGMLFEQSNDMSKAKEYYYKGLSLKDSAALYRMGMMSLLGQHGETKDYQGGLERIRNAADCADEDAPQGAYVYGMLIGRDLPDITIPEGLLPYAVETAKMYVEKAAYLGFAKAQLKMGQAYELCQLGCDFNPSYSLHYYGLAAKQGIPEAALGVSRWFLFGYEGVFKKNEELAFKYAHEAASAKLPTGEFAMGYYHEIGIHVNKDVVEAQRWYQLAADHGNKDAVGRLESLSQDKSLSKTDHETTTLTRIKSQHGSMRGKRPERFKQANPMPTVSEGTDGGPPPLPKLVTSVGSSRPSPVPSPGMRPTIVENNNFAEPSRASFVDSSDRQPAFNIRVDSNAPPMRSQSAAPYPAPRPTDQAVPSVSGHRQAAALVVPAQGRCQAHSRLATCTHLTSLLLELAVAEVDPVLAPGLAQDAHTEETAVPEAPTRMDEVSRLKDTVGRRQVNTVLGRHHGQGRMDMPILITAALAVPVAPEGTTQREWVLSPHKLEDTQEESRYAKSRHAQSRPSPVPSAASAPSKPSKAPSKQGPATFEDMGIPQGKQDGDCVVM
ncbi:chitin synthase regulatory factor 4 [Trichoderma asperellum]|uniref:Chitin synthase regulatory factor 4 n=1 Tax=Trichoderma asperellum TaxID=101201 RepID=A0A6V8R4W5_TRIAP|nr:chitin synthase regulatory factor 4 [Trichoderma asperellum]